MKKLFIFTILIAASLSLASCSSSPDEGNNYSMNQGTPYEKLNLRELCDMRYIGDDLSVDETTGVIYYTNFTSRRMSVLVYEDGRPKNIKDFIKSDKKYLTDGGEER